MIHEYCYWFDRGLYQHDSPTRPPAAMNFSLWSTLTSCVSHCNLQPKSPPFSLLIHMERKNPFCSIFWLFVTYYWKLIFVPFQSLLFKQAYGFLSTLMSSSPLIAGSISGLRSLLLPQCTSMQPIRSHSVDLDHPLFCYSTHYCPILLTVTY